MEEKKYFDAAEAFQKAASLDPLVGSQVNLAEAYYRLGWFDDSIATAKEALRIGMSFDHYYVLGLAYAGKEQWSEARDALFNAVELRPVTDWGPKYTEAYRYLGLAQTRLGEASQVISRLEDAIQGNPNLAVERLELGNLYLWTGNVKGAKEQLRELRTRDKALAEALESLISEFRAG